MVWTREEIIPRNRRKIDNRDGTAEEEEDQSRDGWNVSTET